MSYELVQTDSLPNVVLMQKDSLAFEATVQVRNKVLKAYEEILNMPVYASELRDKNGDSSKSDRYKYNTD